MSDLELRIGVEKVALKGAISTLPVIGGIINEIISEIVPDRRIERLDGLLERLDNRVAKLEPVPSRDRWTEPTFVDLLEDGFLDAARATSTERLDHIAAILSGGLPVEQPQVLHRRFLLGLLAELNDVEVLLLAGKGEETQGSSRAFYERHGKAMSRPHPTFSSVGSKLETAAIFQGYDRHP